MNSTTRVVLSQVSGEKPDASSFPASDRGVKRGVDDLMTEIEQLASEGRLPSWRVAAARDLYRFTLNVLREALR